MSIFASDHFIIDKGGGGGYTIFFFHLYQCGEFHSNVWGAWKLKALLLREKLNDNRKIPGWPLILTKSKKNGLAVVIVSLQ